MVFFLNSCGLFVGLMQKFSGGPACVLGGFAPTYLDADDLDVFPPLLLSPPIEILVWTA